MAERTKKNGEAQAGGQATKPAAALPHLADAALVAPVAPAQAPAQEERILSAAAQLFLEKGITEAKMTDVAAAAGVGVATLYRRSSKTQLAVDAGTLMWRRFAAQVQALVASPAYLQLSGLPRLQALYREYAAFYMAQPNFVAFTDELDRLIITEHVEPAALAAYNAQVNSFYGVFNAAYELGLSDGSVQRRVNFAVFYRAVAHAMTGVAAKIVRGNVLPTDDYSAGSQELDCIADMALWRLSAPGGAEAPGKE